jgi:flagellar hook-length control protein FliK
VPSVASQTNHLPSHLHLPNTRNRSETDAKTHNSPFAMLLDSAAPQPQASPTPPGDRVQPPANRDDKAPASDRPEDATTQAAQAPDQANTDTAPADADVGGGAAAATDGPAPKTDDAKAVALAKMLETTDSADTAIPADAGSDQSATDQAAVEQAATALNGAVTDIPRPTPDAVVLPALPIAQTQAQDQGEAPAQVQAPVQAPAQVQPPAQAPGQAQALAQIQAQAPAHAKQEATDANPFAGLQGIGDGVAAAAPNEAQAGPGKPVAAEAGKTSAPAKDGQPEAHTDKFQARFAVEDVAAKGTVDAAAQTLNQIGAANSDTPSQNPLSAAFNTQTAASHSVNTPQAAAVPLSGLAVEIASQASAGNHRFEIRLDPPELGRIDVRLDVDRDGRVSTRLVVDRADTLDLLKRDAGELQRALQQAGLKTSDNTLEFSLRQQAFGRDDAPPQGAAQIVVPDDDPAPLEAMRQGYARLLGLGGGLDITV